MVKIPGKVLVVDDDPMNRELVESQLIPLGYDVILADSGEDALAKVREFLPDVVLLDIMMPGIDGFEVARQIKSHNAFRHIPIVMVTAITETRDRIKALKAGANDFLSKPVDKAELQATVNSQMQVKAYNDLMMNYQSELEAEVNRKTRQLQKALEKVRQSEEKYRHLIEGSIQGVLVHKDFSPRLVNRAWAGILGYTPGEIMAMPSVLDLISSRDQARISEYTDSCLAGEAFPPVYEYQAVSKDRDLIWVENRIMKISWEGETAIQSIIIDIDERKQEQEKKKLMEKQLAHSQKMESLGTLAGGIAHDFNNILSVILGFGQLLAREAEKGSGLQDDLQEILTAADRAKDLVKQILAFARQSDVTKEPVQVYLIAKETLKFIRSSIPAAIEINQRIESRSFIMGAAVHVHQIFMNLCTNAAQAMEPDGGILSLSVSDTLVREEDDFGPGLKLNPGVYVQIMISDTGAGIPENIIDKIFEPYFTTKPVGEGTGLGLSLVHGIVEEMKGKITVRSEPGKGTVFKIYLPTLERKRRQRLPAREKLPRGSETILVVDDEKQIVRIIGRTLEDLGYSVETGSDGADALEKFRSEPDAFDLVITDLGMPKMNGDKLTRELIKIRPDIPVILCSGYHEKRIRQTARTNGFSAVINKPVDQTDLAETVRRVLNEKTGGRYDDGSHRSSHA